MITAGLLVRVTAKPGTGLDAEDLLRTALRLARSERQTSASLLLRFDAAHYALVCLFTDDLARREHLAGAAAQALHYRACLFAAPADATPLDAVALDPWLLDGAASFRFGAVGVSPTGTAETRSEGTRTAAVTGRAPCGDHVVVRLGDAPMRGAGACTLLPPEGVDELVVLSDPPVRLPGTGATLRA